MDAKQLQQKLGEAQKIAAEIGELESSVQKNMLLLEKKRARLAELGVKIDTDLTPTREEGDDVTPLTSRIKKLFKAHSGRKFDADTVAKLLGEEGNIDSVRSILARLSREGKIKRPDPGVYTL